MDTESDSLEARPDARKKHDHVETAREKACGEGNIGTKAAPRRSSEGTRNPSKGILVSGWFGDLRLG